MQDLEAPLPSDAQHIRKPLRNLIQRSRNLLILASSLSKHTAIVTLARKPWVQTCMSNFAPGLAKTINSLGIPIIYARSFVNEGRDDDYNKQRFSSAQAEVAYWTGVKAAAIDAQCRECYSQYDGQSWKNVISIGDSDFERQATYDTMKAYQGMGGEPLHQSKSRGAEDTMCLSGSVSG